MSRCDGCLPATPSKIFDGNIRWVYIRASAVPDGRVTWRCRMTRFRSADRTATTNDSQCREGHWLSDLRLDGREFDSRPPRPGSTGMGDRLRTRKPPRCFIKPPRQTQPPTLYAGREMSTGRSVVMLCGWGVKAIFCGCQRMAKVYQMP